MLELRNLTLPLSGRDPKSSEAYEPKRLIRAVARRLGMPEGEVASCQVMKLAVDARKKADIHFVATALVELKGGTTSEIAAVSRLGERDAALWEPSLPSLPAHADRTPSSDAERPVIVGAGCAGIFCALTLAEAGYAPLLLEQGDDATARTATVTRFNETGVLDPSSNIQFGAGGAGTFSDGKLTTGTKSPAIPWVTRAFVDAGASPRILWQAHPHIGSDVLPGVVSELVGRIERAGGSVRFRTRVDELIVEGGVVTGVVASSQRPNGSFQTERIAAGAVILACGHSARGIYRHLYELGVALERKTFAIGARIEHPQVLVNRAQYAKASGHPALPAAEYKLSHQLGGGRGAFTFCMCPGGEVVAAASEPGGVVTNGMSESARAGMNANSALLVNVLPGDLEGDDPLAGVELQRACEHAAFDAGGGGFMAPAQLVGDFLHETPSTGQGSVTPTYPRGVTWGSLDATLPRYVIDGMREAIRAMAHRLRGFDNANAVLTGVESRSSAPVRIPRDATRQSVSIHGLFPCGEGAGYAGGIMSAATDGIATAVEVAESLRG